MSVRGGIRLLLLSTVLLGTGMALPTQAHPAAEAFAAVFDGELVVCADNGPSWKPPASGCPLVSGGGTHGLYYPQPGATRTGQWSLTTPFCKIGWNWVWSLYKPPVPPPTPGPGQITECGIAATGELGPVQGIGAACGFSQGHSGGGEIEMALGFGYDLFDLGWASSVGGLLPITGRYVFNGPTRADKPPLDGPVVGLVQVQGGAACAGGSGASTFRAVGVLGGP